MASYLVTMLSRCIIVCLPSVILRCPYRSRVPWQFIVDRAYHVGTTSLAGWPVSSCVWIRRSFQRWQALGSLLLTVGYFYGVARVDRVVDDVVSIGSSAAHAMQLMRIAGLVPGLW